MTTTTSKGYQYPTIVGGSSTDTVTSYPPSAAANALLHEARPGVSSVTTTVRNAYTGIDLWDGRIIWNTTTLRLEKYDLGTTSWIPAAAGASPATTVAGPAAFGDATILGTSLLYARQDHNHGLPATTGLATTAALTTETTRATTAETAVNVAVGNEATTRAIADALLLPKLNGILTSAFESVYVTGSAPTYGGEIDITTNSSLLFFTAAASTNFLPNFRSTPTVTLNALMAVNTSITVTMLVTQGATPYFCSTCDIDGASQTVHWQGGIAPTAGFASGIDAYTFTIIKTASATFTVLASLTQF